MSDVLFTSAFLRLLDQLALQTRRAMAGEMQGERRSPRRGSSVEFADYRPYVAGDDFRQIDWNLYARAERYFLKLFVAEEELTIHLLLDTSRSMNYGQPDKLTYARRVVGALGYIALNNLDRVTVTAFGGGPGAMLPGVRGKRGALPLLTFLQRLTLGTHVGLVDVCRRYAQSARNAGPLFLASDLLDAGWQDALRALTSRPFEITLLHMLAPQEISPQLDGDFRLIDSEGGAPVEITADLHVLRQYQQNLARWRAEVEQFCHGRQINYVFCDTSVPVEELITATLRRRGVLR